MNLTCQEATEKLIKACKMGDLAQARYWLPFSDPQTEGSLALFEAARLGHGGLVDLLLPVSDPKDVECLALAAAVSHGHLSIVRRLLPVSNPLARESWPLWLAAKNADAVMVGLLAPHSDSSLIWKNLLRDKAWSGLDVLSPHMPLETIRLIMGKAPKSTVPQIEARVLDDELRQCLKKALPADTVPLCTNRARM